MLKAISAAVDSLRLARRPTDGDVAT